MTIVLVGFIVGVCVAFSGVGAGALTTPLLLFMGFDASVAIGSDLLFSLGTKISALAAHFHRRTIDLRVLGALAAGGVPGSIAGALLTVWLHARFDAGPLDRMLRILVGCALVISAAVLLLRKHRDPDESAAQRAPALPRAALAVVGAFVGVMVSLTSIGSGSLTLPLLLLVVPTIALRPLVGTDVAFAVVLLVPAILGHWRAGDVNARLSGELLAGSIPGTFLGAYLSSKFSGRWFRMVLGVVLLAVSIRLFL